MFDKIVEISQIDPEKLKSEIRTIHQRHGTSEYSFLISEIPSLRERFDADKLMDVFAPAVAEFRRKRRLHLAL